MPLVPVLAEMERNGFLLDVEGLEGLSKELERELDVMVGGHYRARRRRIQHRLAQAIGYGALREARPETGPQNQDRLLDG